MIQSLLLQWFRKNKRSLPWRRVRDPYAIWISEIMLQQTQVNTVIPYYERWMKKFPDVRKLAKAPLAEVLKHWEGLGYYRRARNLHRTAQIVWRKGKGKFPDSSDELQKLPGIGRYTAGAIASIAFNKPEPILDGNVKRVLARVLALREPMDKTSGEKRLWETSRRLVQGTSEPGDLNQALMELGALVCLPENPKCLVCPLKKVCKAHRIHQENEFPVKARREKTEKLKTVATVIWKNGRVLLQRQPLEGRWGGLWMFPQWILRNGKREAVFLREKIRQKLGIRIEKLRSWMEIQHGFTKYRVRLKVYEGEVNSTPSVIASPPRFLAGKAIPIQRLRSLSRGREIASLPSVARNDGRGISNGLLATTYWVEPGNLSRFPLPSPHQKIAHGITSHA